MSKKPLSHYNPQETQGKSACGIQLGKLKESEWTERKEEVTCKRCKTTWLYRRA